MLQRRSFITGLISLVAAPTIVRAGRLMPVKVIKPEFVLPEYLRDKVSDYVWVEYKLPISMFWFGPDNKIIELSDEETTKYLLDLDNDN